MNEILSILPAFPTNLTKIFNLLAVGRRARSEASNLWLRWESDLRLLIQEFEIYHWHLLHAINQKKSGHILWPLHRRRCLILFSSIEIVFRYVCDARYFSHKGTAVTRRNPTARAHPLDIRDVREEAGIFERICSQQQPGNVVWRKGAAHWRRPQHHAPVV